MIAPETSTLVGYICSQKPRNVIGQLEAVKVSDLELLGLSICRIMSLAIKYHQTRAATATRCVSGCQHGQMSPERYACNQVL
jgi:hypothetical protein